MYTLSKLFNNAQAVYKIFANNTSDTVFEKRLQVQIKYGTQWADISSEVAQVEIQHQMQINGSSNSDKAEIELYNEIGQFDVSKVTDSFNPSVKKFNPLVSDQPFLLSNFPIKINLVYEDPNNQTQIIPLFLGYAYKVSSKSTRASITAFDILFHFTRRILYTGIAVPKIKVDDALYTVIQPVLDEIKTDFDLSSIPIYINNSELTSINKITANEVLLNIEGGSSYLDVLNKMMSALFGFLTYIPQSNRLQVILPIDDTYQTYLNAPSTNYTINTSEIDDFSITTNEDIATKLTVQSQLYELYPEAITDYWLFRAEDIKNAIKIPKDSNSTLDIKFSAKGLPNNWNENGNLILEKLTLGTYDVYVNSKGELEYRSYGGVPVPLENKIINFNQAFWWLNDELQVKQATLKIDGLQLLVTNYSKTTNYCILECQISAIPIVELGAITHIYDTGKKPIKEQTCDLAYFVSSDTFKTFADRIVKAYYMVNNTYTATVRLTGFYPDIFAGGLVNISLPDTSIVNSKAIVKRVYHVIEGEKYVTELELGLIGVPTYISNIPTYEPLTGEIIKTPPKVNYNGNTYFV